MTNGPAQSRVTYSRVLRTSSSWLLTLSEVRGSTTSLGYLCQSFTTIAFILIPRSSICARCVSSNCWIPQRRVWLVFFTPPISNPVFIHFHKTLPEPALPQEKWSELSQPLFLLHVLQSLSHLSGPLLDSLQYVHVLLFLGSPEAALRMCLRSAE